MTAGMSDPLREGAAPRLGPRPLALHLGTAASTWLNSLAVLPLLRSGLLPWRPELAAAADELEQKLNGVDPEAFAAAVEVEIRRRLAALADGIKTYRHHPYRRAAADPPAVWRAGSTRLLDYGAVQPSARDGAPILVVPSHINRGYVLDISRGRSLMRYLAGRGLRPFLVEWGRPGARERGFTLTDYIAGRLEAALDTVRALSHRAPAVIGYCMGGLLALALAQRRERDISGLVLLATPWDFHAKEKEAEQARALARAFEPLWPAIDRLGVVPVDVLQALFYALDPYLVARKFRAFATLDPASPKAEAFVALEDWLNDGVPLVAAVARECLAGWYGANTPARGAWRVAGQAVRPESLTLPALVVIPERDRIVPPASAAALAAAIPGADRSTLALGHIGMVVGSRAKTALWRPLAGWLKSVVPA